MKADGTKADPIRIVEAQGENNVPWDNRLIGNGSKIEAKFVVKDYGPGRKKGMYLRAIRVLELIPFVAQDFAPLTPDDEFFASTAVNAPAETKPFPLPEGLEPIIEDDLNDDIPV